MYSTQEVSAADVEDKDSKMEVDFQRLNAVLRLAASLDGRIVL